MQQAHHPDDERLAALAASDPDAAADASLVSHVAGCSRCAPMVEDLRALHSALAELPDIQPSRPLRFLPAVPEPRAQGSRWVGFLRGVTGPAMAIAVLLIVVGSFGTAFSNGIGLMGSAGAAPAAASAANADARSAGGASPLATSESGKGQVSQPMSSASSAPVAAGRTASASATASANPTSNDGLGNFGAYGPMRGRGEAEQIRPPFGLVLGFGVVLLAVAFVARAYVRRRSLS